MGQGTFKTTPVEAYDGMGCLDENVLASSWYRSLI